MTDFSISLPAKRRRGRPRKDGNLSATLRTLENPILINKNAQRIPPTHPTFDARKGDNNNVVVDDANAQSKTNGTIVVDDMVGSTIYGVVEGAFDAGYLISVRIGNNEAPFRGVVFQPKKIVPITTENDVAPQATMYRRQDIKVPLSPLPQKVAATETLPSSANQSYYNNQPAFMMSDDATMLRTSSVPNMGGITTTTSRPTPNAGSSQHSPGAVHHNEAMMQEFQASSPSTRGPEFNALEPISAFTHNKQSTRPNVEFPHNFMEDAQGATFDNREVDQPREPKDIYYSSDHTRGSPSVDFHQDLFTCQSQPNSTRSGGTDFNQRPSLKFDLSSTTLHEKRQSPTQDARSYFVGNEVKSPINLGYHHALVSGNPLLLPPEFSGEPLEFMLDHEKNQPLPKNKAQQETSTEGGGSSPSDPYKLELATPRSTVNGRADEQTINSNCITDMDFVLSDVVEHEGEHCETKHRL